MKNNASAGDMGSGSVPKLVAKLAIPSVVAQLINMLYNIVDRIYIGHIPEVGSSALTGVGLFLPILMLLNAFAMLVGSGGAPLAAIAMGRGDNKEAEKIMGNSFITLLIFSAVLSTTFFISAPALLRWFGASDLTLPYAVEYARIYVLGSVFVLMVLGMNPFVSTQGFAKFSMLTIVIGAVINIILDPIFIFLLGMGVRGAALATVISQAVGALWVLKFLCGRKTILHLRRCNFRVSGRIMRPVLALGVSSFVMMSTESLLSISFNSSLSKFGGDMAVGAMTIISSVAQLVLMPLNGICQGGQPVISYNFGAGKIDRVKKAFYTQYAASVVYATVFWLALMAFPQMFARIFTPDAELAAYTARNMRLYMLAILAMGSQIGCQQGFVALGQAKVSLFMACLRKLILLIPLIYILPMLFEDKVFAVFLAEPVCDLIAAAVTTITFFVSFKGILARGARKL